MLELLLLLQSLSYFKRQQNCTISWAEKYLIQILNSDSLENVTDVFFLFKVLKDKKLKNDSPNFEP